MTLQVAVVLTADGRQLKAEVVGSKEALDRFAGSVRATGQDAGRAGDSARRFASDTQNMARQITLAERTTSLLRTAVVGLGAALGARQVLAYADAWTQATNALRIATKDSAELTAVQGQLFDIAQRTKTPFAEIVQLYSRLSVNGKELGASQAELLRFVEATGNALRTGGTNAQQASGALLQMSQALGGAIVRAEEFNSVLEGAPTIARAVAQGLDAAGGSVAKLRQLVVEGKVASEDWFRALLTQFPQLADTASTAVTTVGQALTTLDNAMGRLIGGMDQASGATSALAGGIEALARNVDLVAAGVIGLSAALAGSFVRSLVAGAGAARALGAALAFFGGPIGIAIGVVSAAVVYLATRTDDATQAQQALNARMSAAQDLATQLAAATGEERRALEGKRDALLATARASVALAEADLARLKAARAVTAIPAGAQIDYTHERYDPATGAFLGTETRSGEVLRSRGTADGYIVRGPDGKEVSVGAFNVQGLSDQRLVGGADAIAKATDSLSAAKQSVSEAESAFRAAETAAGGLTSALEEQSDAYKKVADRIADLKEEARLSGLDDRAAFIARELAKAQADLQKISDPTTRAQLTEQLKAEAGAAFDAAEAAKARTKAIAEGQKATQEAARTAAEYEKDLQGRAKAEDDARTALTGLVDGLREEQLQIGLTDRARFARQKLLEAEQIALEGGIELSAAYKKQLEEEAHATFDAAEASRKKQEQDQRAQEEQKRLVEERARDLAAPFVHAGEQLQDVFADAFRSVLDTGTFGFARLADIAKNFAAEVAAAWVFNPIIRPVLDALTPNVASAAAGSARGAGFDFLSGAAGLSDLLGFGDRGSTSSTTGSGGLFGGGLFGGIGDLFSSSFSNGIFGANFGAPLRFVGGAGSGPANFAGGVSLGGLLGDSALLGLGGFGLSLLGGADVGQAALTGGGALLGNLALPGIGGIAGGFLGSIIGSLFGGKPQTPAANQFFTLGPGGTSPFAGGSASFPGDLQGTVTAAGTDWASGFAAVLDQLGAKLTDDIVAGLRLGARGYGYKIVDDGRVVKDSSRAGNDGSLQTASTNLTLDVLRYAAGAGKLDANVVVRNLVRSAGSLDELSTLADLAHRIFEELTPEPASAMVQALEDLNEAFEAGKKHAAAFGTTVEEIERRRVAAVTELRDDYTTGIQEQILGIINPSALSLVQLQKQFKATIDEAGGLGLTNLDDVRALFRLQAAQAAGPYLGDLSAQATGYQARIAGLEAFQQNLKLSDLSPLTPGQRLGTARSGFEDIARRAQLGEVAAVEQLPSFAETFLRESRFYNASGEDYTADVERVQSVTAAVESVQERQLKLLEAQIAKLEEQIAELKDSNAIAKLNQRILDALGVKLADANDLSKLNQKILEKTLEVIATYLPATSEATDRTATGVRDLADEVAHGAGRPAAAGGGSTVAPSSPPSSPAPNAIIVNGQRMQWQWVGGVRRLLPAGR